MWDLLFVSAAAFVGGVVNAVAGGGTFFTLPALVAVGVPPVAANATSALAVFPGYAASALGFRAELRSFERRFVLRLVAVTLAGSFAGSLLLLVSSNEAFSAIVPVLLLGSTLAFVFGDRIRARAAARGRPGAARPGIGMALACVYGGYFNGGLGIMLLALFALWGMEDLSRMNALKNVAAFTVSTISVATFAAAGLIDWSYATAMMLAATAGGYAGAPLVRIVPRPIMRAAIATIGLGVTAGFAWRLVA